MSKYINEYRETMRQRWFQVLPPIKEIKKEFEPYSGYLERSGVPSEVISAVRKLATGGPLRYPTDDSVKTRPLSVYEWLALNGNYLTKEEQAQRMLEIQYWRKRNWEGLPKPDKPNRLWLIHPIGFFIAAAFIYSLFFLAFGDLLWGIVKFILQGICFPFTLIGMATGVVSEDYGAGMGLAVGMFIFAAVVMAIMKAFR